MSLISDEQRKQIADARCIQEDDVKAIEAAVLEAQKQELVACPDKGPWSAGKTDDGRVYIESEDFEHDVRLYVDGDFAPGDMKHYAERMAAWMNAAPVVQPGMVDSIKAFLNKREADSYSCSLLVKDLREMIAAAEGKE